MIDLYHGLYRAAPVNLTEEADALMADLRSHQDWVLAQPSVPCCPAQPEQAGEAPPPRNQCHCCGAMS
jgi:hypothetical protein